ncbi:uncharacterized protein M421DRAFT_424063 [Didymella exigua CBS 183.55]|uniref:Secreted protein n=1 Tax=Didymella exigua CBS 183.55 TaxID=1150837 RepID=A0A6A5RAL0_9PLEO|nr:uncharacterized protein M421DRAFT_424063 [Didymella exigua CBS 183.55]KAF1925261.1 hypothetical protein M421DRAFT_424063 [Didymella exigua CBS 183.55]
MAWSVGPRRAGTLLRFLVHLSPTKCQLSQSPTTGLIEWCCRFFHCNTDNLVPRTYTTVLASSA